MEAHECFNDNLDSQVQSQTHQYVHTHENI